MKKIFLIFLILITTNSFADVKDYENINYYAKSDSKLIETKKTQERIKHTLDTGKPLIN